MTTTAHPSALATGARRSGAALLLLALLAGIPAVLWLVGGNPLPATLPTGQDVLSALAHPFTPTLLTGLVLVIGWLAWATFALAVVLESTRGAAPRQHTPPGSPLSGWRPRPWARAPQRSPDAGSGTAATAGRSTARSDPPRPSSTPTRGPGPRHTDTRGAGRRRHRRRDR